jgi:hypothetical protein
VATSRGAPDPDPSWLDAVAAAAPRPHALARDARRARGYAACEGRVITDVVCGDVIAPSATIARIRKPARRSIDRPAGAQRVTGPPASRRTRSSGPPIATIAELAYTART